MLKVGLIGNGMIAKSHWGGYKRLFESGEAQVVAVCDVRTECLEGLGDVRTYTDADEMLKAEAGKLDFVDICVPTYLHAEIAIKALEAGFHVLSEKPMARTVEQAERMIEAAKRTGKLLMIAYCNRFYVGAREIKKMIDSKEFGEVRSAEFRREGGDENPFGWNNWFRDGDLSGGAILDLHIHDVDMIRWMFGMPKAVTASAASYITRNGYDAVSANFIYDNNVFVNATCDWTIAHDKFNTRCIRVNFAKGYVFVDRTDGRTAFVKVARSGEVTDMTENLKFDAYYEEIKYFASCVREGKKLDYNLPSESIDSVRIVMAEMESADRNGEKIVL